MLGWAEEAAAVAAYTTDKRPMLCYEAVMTRAMPDKASAGYVSTWTAEDVPSLDLCEPVATDVLLRFRQQCQQFEARTGTGLGKRSRERRENEERASALLRECQDLRQDYGQWIPSTDYEDHFVRLCMHVYQRMVDLHSVLRQT